MSNVRFTHKDLSTYRNPPAGFTIIGYDVDGILKQKDSAGNITPLAGSASVTYTNAEAMPVAVGGWEAGSTFSGKTVQEMWDGLLYPELFPTLTAPSSTFTFNVSPTLREIGEVISTISFNSSFNRGSIDPAYTTSGYRSGLPNTYVYTGTGLTASASTSLTDAQSISSYTVLVGAQSWTGNVAFDEGEQPLSNKGNPYSTPLTAGNTSTITRTITGAYPVFATTSSITVYTKQSLVAHGGYITTSLVAESGSDKQTVDIPTSGWTITSLEQYNTLSASWDAIDLSTFTVSDVTNTVQGNTVNYKRYVHNGSLIGARQLRWH
jgi:hypothetical protein